MSSSTLTESLTRGSDREPDAGRRNAPRRSRRWLGVLAPTALLGLWAGLSGTGVVGVSLLPPPWTVLESARDFFFGEQVLTLAGVVPFVGAGADHVAASVLRCLVSYSAAVAVGLSVGLVLGLSRLASDLFDPVINGLRAVPLYAWLPISLVWFGLGEGAARALIFIGALWPVLIATADSVSRVPRGHVEAARMLGVPRHRMWRRVYLPSALPEVVTGLRLSLTLAWMSVIVGELTGTTTGVGAMMNSARESGRIDQIVVGMFVFAVVGFVADLVLRLVTRPWVRWSLT